MTSNSIRRRRRSGRIWAAGVCMLALLAQPAFVEDAGAAEEAGAGLSELKAAAYDAQEAAARAREAAERAQAAVKAAQAQSEVPEQAPAPAPETVATPATEPGSATAVAQEAPAPPPVAPVAPAPDAASAEKLERATAQARAAAEDARRALKELEEQKRRHALRYARKGFYLGGGVFYAPQHFDDLVYLYQDEDYATFYPLKVKSSRGFYGQLGYRVHPRVSLDLRYDWIEGFELSHWDQAEGELDGWALTGNLQLFLFTGSFQPYLGFGLGVIKEQGSLQVSGDTNGYYEETFTEPAMRLCAGIDYYLSETVAVNLDAAFVAPGGELKYYDYSTLSAGIKLRF